MNHETMPKLHIALYISGLRAIPPVAGAAVGEFPPVGPAGNPGKQAWGLAVRSALPGESLPGPGALRKLPGPAVLRQQ